MADNLVSETRPQEPHSGRIWAWILVVRQVRARQRIRRNQNVIAGIECVITLAT
jgi:hypothetical protein